MNENIVYILMIGLPLVVFIGMLVNMYQAQKSEAESFEHIYKLLDNKSGGGKRAAKTKALTQSKSSSAKIGKTMRKCGFNFKFFLIISTWECKMVK